MTVDSHVLPCKKDLYALLCLTIDGYRPDSIFVVLKKERELLYRYGLHVLLLTRQSASPTMNCSLSRLSCHVTAVNVPLPPPQESLQHVSSRDEPSLDLTFHLDVGEVNRHRNVPVEVL